MLCLIVKGPPDWWRYQAIVKPVCCVWSWQRRNEGWQKYSGKSGTLQVDDLNKSCPYGKKYGSRDIRIYQNEETEVRCEHG